MSGPEGGHSADYDACGWTPPERIGDGLPAPVCARRDGHDGIHSADPDLCTCSFYVVDYSDPERFHPENVDREDDPACLVHRVIPPEGPDR